MNQLLLLFCLLALVFLSVAALYLRLYSRLQSDKEYTSVAWKIVTRSFLVCAPVFLAAIMQPELSSGGPLAIILGMCISVTIACYHTAVSRRLDGYSRRTCMYSQEKARQKATKATSNLTFGLLMLALFLLNLSFYTISAEERLLAHLLFFITFIIGMAVFQFAIPSSWKRQEDVKEEEKISSPKILFH
ncbi:MAG: hypothetical protein ACM3PZ_03190 [Bacillota bacterium]